MKVKAPFRVTGHCRLGFSIEAYRSPWRVATKEVPGKRFISAYVHVTDVWTRKPADTREKGKSE